MQGGDGVEDEIGRAGRLAVAMDIGQVEIGAGLDGLLFGGVVDLDDRHDPGAGGQFFEAAGEGGQGGFVAGQ